MKISHKIFNSGNDKMSRDFAKKCQKNSENVKNLIKFPEFVRNFHFSFYFFIRLPIDKCGKMQQASAG